MKDIEEIKVFSLETSENATSYRQDIENERQFFPGVEILSFEDVESKKLVLLDAQGIKIKNIKPYERNCFIRNPFRKDVFHVFDTAIYELFERERFMHFKEVAHLLGMKHYEVYKLDKKVDEETVKAKLDGFLPMEGEFQENKMKQEAFFTEEEYWPIKNTPDVSFYETCYQEALLYAKEHFLDEALDFKELLLSRKPKRNVIRTKVLKYSYLSCASSSLGFALSLENVFKIIPKSPYTAFIPTGGSIEKVKKACESQSVNLKIDFFNFSNEQLPIWENLQKVDEKYEVFAQQYLDDQVKSFFNSATESKKMLHESKLLDVPKASEYVSDEEHNKKAMISAKTSMDQLQQHKIDDVLKVEDFSNLENSLTNLRKIDANKDEVEKLKNRFNQVVSDDINQHFKMNIEEINKLFAEILN